MPGKLEAVATVEYEDGEGSPLPAPETRDPRSLYPNQFPPDASLYNESTNNDSTDNDTMADGYTISHGQDADAEGEYEYATEEETNKMLEDLSADMERQAEDSVALEPLDGVDPELLKRRSVPFV